MLSISRKADYALVAMAELAIAGRRHSARALAERTGAPLPVLRNLLKALQQAGLLTSSQGAFGGYALARAGDRISVLEVIESIDGPVALTRCCGDGEAGSDHCRLEQTCKVRWAINRINASVSAQLGRLTIDDLVAPFDEAHGEGDTPATLTVAAARPDERTTTTAPGDRGEGDR